MKNYYSQVEIPREAYSQFINFDFSPTEQKQNYKRMLQYRDLNLEVYVICWEVGQKTLIHDHPKNGCLLRVLEGEICEEVFVQNKGNRFAKRQSEFE